MRGFLLPTTPSRATARSHASSSCLTLNAFHFHFRHQDQHHRAKSYYSLPLVLCASLPISSLSSCTPALSLFVFFLPLRRFLERRPFHLFDEVDIIELLLLDAVAGAAEEEGRNSVSRMSLPTTGEDSQGASCCSTPPTARRRRRRWGPCLWHRQRRVSCLYVVALAVADHRHEMCVGPFSAARP